MDFQFQPWEKLSDATADGPADGRVAKSGDQDVYDELVRASNFKLEGDWLVRRCGPLAWVRDSRMPTNEWNFWLVCPPLAASAQPTANYLPHFKYLLNPRHSAKFLCRVWMLSARPLIVVTWNEICGWRLEREFFQSANFPPHSAPHARSFSWRFRFSHPAPAQTPSSESFDLLGDEWCNPASDLRQVARFGAHIATLSELEIALFFLETQHETAQRFIAVMKAALRTFGPQWIGESGVSVVCDARENGFYELNLMGEYEPLYGPDERELLQRIMSFFQPRLPKNWEGLSSGVETLAQSEWARHLPVHVAPPSQHEQLEAMLELRAWLGQHWPDGVRHLEKIVWANEFAARKPVGLRRRLTPPL